MVGRIAFSPVSADGSNGLGRAPLTVPSDCQGPGGGSAADQGWAPGPVGATERILQRHEITRARRYASSHGGEESQHLLHLVHVHAREAGGEGVRGGCGR